MKHRAPFNPLRTAVCIAAVLGMLWASAEVLGYAWLSAPYEYMWSVATGSYTGRR
jgi:hypothetical protein